MMHEGDQAGAQAGFSPQKLVREAHMLHMRAQHLIDSMAPYTVQRWAATGVLLFLFLLRIVLAEGWYIVCYALFIYLLNLFLAFLTPKFDPALESDLAAQDVEEGEPGLPTSARAAASSGGLMSSVFHPTQQDGDQDEFRPFIRRLPEFKFWVSATQATVLSIFASFFEAFNIPVFWPVLVVYFMVLFVLTMRRQIQHMIQYKYLPFDMGRKARYGSS
ncbi:hypothetical protein MBRA1_003471 [Malassezia brasiliensis]|uniref:Protein RER1 n=1 Tax=Malassezia brasiliensis TaxID=1821822 RepID=A0AAF0DVD3_9BASI|nr:hypothetical protein MBRA1_003471 [Malassezia brasiliensis]